MKRPSWPLVLIVWTVGIWGSRLRNALADEDLSGGAQVLSIGIAAGFVLLALVLAWLRRQQHPWARPALELLCALGVLRFSIRGPLILASDEWGIGFKVVHTILWTMTVALSVLAWRNDQLKS